MFTPSHGAADVYLGVVDVPGAPEMLDGAPFMARVHFGLIEGRAQCVGLELCAFTTEALEPDEDGSVSGWTHPLEGWQPLTSRRLRTLRLDSLVEKARPLLLAQYQRLVDHLEADPSDPFHELALSAMGARAGSLAQHPQPTRPGRPAHLSDEELRTVVARTYMEHVRLGGRKPVQAVLEALKSSTSLGGREGHVTLNQARAAVRRARAAGYLPPAIQKGEQHG